MKQHSRITPRLIRFRDVPRYLGMDRNRFNAEVRPYFAIEWVAIHAQVERRIAGAD